MDRREDTIQGCGCPVHHRHDCPDRPRIPTHAYRPHPKWPWWCRDCGYPEHERLKHHPIAPPNTSIGERDDG
jgi:hypothetical protein